MAPDMVIFICHQIQTYYVSICGPDSSVGIANGYGLYGPRIESHWRDFLHLSRPALGPTQPPIKWVPGLFPGGKAQPGCHADPSPPSSVMVMKG